MDFILALLSIDTILIVIAGTLAGIVVGILPGLGGPTGVALLLPFTFSMSPVNALLLLGGVYMGSSYGGSVTAVLLNAPGTEAAAATSLEGYPLMKQGRAKEAIYLSLASSFMGGLFGVLVLLFFTPVLGRIALKFGPPEMFLLAMTGIAIIAALAGRNLAKGLAAGAAGVLLSTVGPDPMSGSSRLTFDFLPLEAGIQLVPCLVGLFAVAEMLSLALRAESSRLSDVPQQDITLLEVFRSILAKKPFLLAKSSVIGTIIGIMPGAGAAVACFIAYGEALRSSKHPEQYGKGNPEGIIAAESANNAAVGGALVPLLALGIPGSTTCAILFGALTIHGLFPGPRLFVEHGEVVYTFMFGMCLTTFAMLIIGRVGANSFAKISDVPLKILVPVVLLLCFVGAYSVRNNSFDIVLTVAFGLLGLVYKISGIPVAPTVLGLILGPICEVGFRQGLTIAQAQQMSMFSYVLFRPLSVILAVLFALVLYTSFKAAKAQAQLGKILDQKEKLASDDSERATSK